VRLFSGFALLCETLKGGLIGLRFGLGLLFRVEWIVEVRARGERRKEKGLGLGVGLV
jgi:hypothetical protein